MRAKTGGNHPASGRLYLRSALIVARSSTARGFSVIHPLSFEHFQTDALGKEALHRFSLGAGASEVGAFVEQHCAGAGCRWYGFVNRLGTMGTLTTSRPRHTAQWWFRWIVAQVLGHCLSIVVKLMRNAPVAALRRLIDWLVRGPLEWSAVEHRAALLEASLIAGGYGDRSPRWRRRIARSVIRGTLRTYLFAYVMGVLSPRRMEALLRAMTSVQGLGHLRRALDEQQGAIVVGLHSELSPAAAMYASTVGPVVQLAHVAMGEQYVSAAEAATSETSVTPRCVEVIDSGRPLAIRALMQRLLAGRIVILAIDVGVAAGAARRVETISFLGHRVPRHDTAAWLSVHTGRPIIFAHGYTEAGKYRGEFSAPILPPAGETADARIRALTEQIYRLAEQRVREHPESWLGWNTLHALIVRSGAAPDGLGKT